ncbi:hypothetical protein R1sor_014568 [Riccia sorocarpa]|uniref:Ribosome biogenesis protein NOP53 n=1 Tax=Riccia sorocarpa TaxID=122646 RepID=A0ABD3HCL7_9MARC
MGKKSKTSRKGKKAWRANISTADTDEFITQQAIEERSGGPLDAVPNESLFFVDKSKDTKAENKTKHREKVPHCDSVLQRNSLDEAVEEKNLPADVWFICDGGTGDGNLSADPGSQAKKKKKKLASVAPPVEAPAVEVKK